MITLSKYEKISWNKCDRLIADCGLPIAKSPLTLRFSKTEPV